MNYETKTKLAITMMELIIVVITISVLTFISVPLYNKAVRNSRNKEARSLLLLIGQACEMYRLESEGVYVPCNSNTQCNSRLDLSLPSGTSRKWNYNVNTPSGTTDTSFCAEASDGTQSFHLNSGSTTIADGGC